MMAIMTAIALSWLARPAVSADAKKEDERIQDVSISGWSPQRNFYIEHQSIGTNETKEVWLVSSRNSKRREMLYEYDREVNILVAGDEKHLVINDHYASNCSETLLYRQIRGIGYTEVDDLGSKAWAYLSQQARNTNALTMGHSYIEVLRWTDDHTLLLSLKGHEDSKQFIDTWLCLYDINTKTFSTDLDRNNQKHVTVQKN